MPLSASVLARLQHQHQTITDIIGDLPEKDLRQRINPDKWSAFENIAHLAAYQPVFIGRLHRLQEEETPTFDRYVAEQDPLFPPYLERSLDQLLVDIKQQRSRILAELTGMNETTLAKKGLHPRYGLFTIPQWSEFFLLHEAHHLYTIFILVSDGRRGLAGSGKP
jgi:hypothetical protein